jgi:hypothetical protein
LVAHEIFLLLSGLVYSLSILPVSFQTVNVGRQSVSAK